MKTKEITNQNFASLVGTGAALVDFWAPWCNPCKMLGPIIEQVATEAPESVLVGKVNVDENEQLAERYEVMTIPTVILFKDGEEVKRFVGVQLKSKLLEEIAAL